MSKRFLFGPVLAVAAVLAAHPVPGYSQGTIEGKVVSTRLTHCDFKPGGCAGDLTLEATTKGQPGQVTINVPLGTPIRKGSETVYLPALRGMVISVVLATEKGGNVARSIEVSTGKP